MTIPASEIVRINPSVLAAAGNAPILSGVFLSQNVLVPATKVLSFSSADAVGQYFGEGSTEYDLANRVYFNGYNGAILRPGVLLIAPYNLANRSALLKSAYLELTLIELQALSGEFSVTVDGTLHSTGSLSLSGATSFSNAATLIESAIGSSVNVSWNATNNSFFIESVSTGGASSITYASDINTSTLAQSLGLTQSSGATIGQGAITDTPETSITNLVNNTISWFSFTTLWEPTQDEKLEFASAINDLNNQYCYSCWDTAADNIVNNSTTCTRFKIEQANYNGTTVISGDANDILNEGSTIAAVTREIAVFILGFVAAVDFSQKNGRTTADFRSLPGLLPSVTNKISYENLISNKCNVYGSFANASNEWIFLDDGNVSGEYKWIDSLYGAVYLDAQLQTQLMELLTNSSSTPYNNSGISSVKLSLSGPIKDAINFGTIRAGVNLSPTQKAIINAQAGLNISNSIFTNGYYLQVLLPSAIDQQNRETFIINLWYTDGQSLQRITINSVDIL